MGKLTRGQSVLAMAGKGGDRRDGVRAGQCLFFEAMRQPIRQDIRSEIWALHSGFHEGM